jgi:Zn-dependent protease
MLNLFSDPLSAILWTVALLVAITIHEFSHAFLADRLGDPTPRFQGRLTLNPLAHLDPLGTLALLFIGFGWGKPVQINPFNLRSPQDAAIISVAGPASNLLLAIIFSAGGLFLGHLSGFIAVVATAIIEVNVRLAVFNLIPIHPLDGGKVLIGILPEKQAKSLDSFLSQYGVIILLFLLLPIFDGIPPVFYLIGPVVHFLERLLIPPVGIGFV